MLEPELFLLLFVRPLNKAGIRYVVAVQRCCDFLWSATLYS